MKSYATLPNAWDELYNQRVWRVTTPKIYRQIEKIQIVVDLGGIRTKVVATVAQSLEIGEVY